MPDPNIITNVDLKNPQHLLSLVKAAPEEPNFLQERYFPCNPDTDIFPTRKVLIEYNATNQKKAPFMKKGTKTSTRDTYITDEFAPARISAGRDLTLDDLAQKGMGEALFSDMTPEQRAAIIHMADFSDLKNRCKRTLEKMAADCMIDNAYTAKYEDTTEGEEITLSFNEGEGVDTQYTPSAMWDASAANIYGDLKAMARMIRQNGCAATDLILGADAADLITGNAEMQKRLDIRRFEIGTIEPKIVGGNANVVLVGLLNVDGVKLNLIQYSGGYEDEESGLLIPYVPANKIIMTAPACGKSLYAAISQLEADEMHHTHRAQFVPKYLGDRENDVRKFQLQCAPLLIPRIKKCWASATVTA